MTNDDDIWQRYAKGVKKIKAPKRSAKTKPPAPQRAARQALPLPMHKATVKPVALPAHLDRQVEKNLRTGMIGIEARIDLHGLTQAQAFDRLARFMAAQVKLGHRRLLVITGKGSGGEGVLRKSLPDWLQNLPEAAALLALRPAAPKHGGDGAFYVLLRNLRPRPESVND